MIMEVCFYRIQKVVYYIVIKLGPLFPYYRTHSGVCYSVAHSFYVHLSPYYLQKR